MRALLLSFFFVSSVSQVNAGIPIFGFREKSRRASFCERTTMALRSGRDLALNLLTFGRERDRQLRAAVSALRPEWIPEMKVALRAMKSFEDEAGMMNFLLDSARLLRSYVGVKSVEDLRAVRETSFSWLQSLHRDYFAIPYEWARMLEEEYFISDFMELYESERTFRGEGRYFEALRNYDWVTRFSGGPTTFGVSRAMNIRFAPEQLERIPWPLLAAALVRHMELIELVNRNEKQIADHLLNEARSMFKSSGLSDVQIRRMIFLNRAEGLQPDLRDALIENSLLRYLAELYGKIRATGEFDELRTIVFEDLLAAPNTHERIAHQVAADYSLLDHPFLNLATRDLDSIVDSMGGISRARIREEKARTQSLPK